MIDDNDDASKGATGGDSKFKSAMQKTGGALAAKGGGAGDTIGGAMMMSGEPTTMAAGATLKVISNIADKRRAERQRAADTENKRRTNLMSAMAQLGTGIGSTGM